MKNQPYSSASVHLSREDLNSIGEISYNTGLTTSSLIRGLVRYSLEQLENDVDLLQDIIHHIQNKPEDG